jgi:hypothetical protein
MSCLANSLQTSWSCHSNSQNLFLAIHDLFVIYLLSQCPNKSKLFNKHFSFVCLVWLCLYGMFMLCYFCVIFCAKSYVLSWEKWKDRILQKGKWHTYLLPIFITALVFFSSMHDRWNIQLFYKMLDPSSE